MTKTSDSKGVKQSQSTSPKRSARATAKPVKARANAAAASMRGAIALGEDSTRQFKRDMTSGDALAAELVAFANAQGGTLFLGVADDGTTPGLSAADVRRLNQLISNTAAHAVRSALAVYTQNVAVGEGRVVIVLTVPKGLDKPYFDKNGIIWLKAGADKRRVNSKEELDPRRKAAARQIPSGGGPMPHCAQQNGTAWGFAQGTGSAYRSPLPRDSSLATLLGEGPPRWQFARAQEVKPFSARVGLLPYRGLGSGVLRALEAWPAIDFLDDRDGGHFVATVRRPAGPADVEESETPQVTAQVTPQVTAQVTPQVEALVAGLEGEPTRAELQEILGLNDREHFRKAYLIPALEAGLIAMTRPDKPQSRAQRYTANGFNLRVRQASIWLRRERSSLSGCEHLPEAKAEHGEMRRTKPFAVYRLTAAGLALRFLHARGSR